MCWQRKALPWHNRGYCTEPGTGRWTTHISGNLLERKTTIWTRMTTYCSNRENNWLNKTLSSAQAFPIFLRPPSEEYSRHSAQTSLYINPYITWTQSKLMPYKNVFIKLDSQRLNKIKRINATFTNRVFELTHPEGRQGGDDVIRDRTGAKGTSADSSFLGLLKTVIILHHECRYGLEIGNFDSSRSEVRVRGS